MLNVIFFPKYFKYKNKKSYGGSIQLSISCHSGPMGASVVAVSQDIIVKD